MTAASQSKTALHREEVLTLLRILRLLCDSVKLSTLKGATILSGKNPMSNLSVQMEPVLATDREALEIKHLAQVLGSETAQVKLVGRDGEEIVIPEPVYRILRQVIHLMASGQAVSLVSLEHELTTQEAADLLNVSRPFLVKLLEQGEIPYIKVGAHRRIRVEDLMAYKQQRDAQRRQCLKELTQFSQDEGFYEASIDA